MGNGEQPRRRAIRDARKGDVAGVWRTACAAPMACRPDPHVDVMLVGNLPDTLGTCMDRMIAHGAFTPRFVRRCVGVGGVIDDTARYAHDVRTYGFAGPEECPGVHGTILPG